MNRWLVALKVLSPEVISILACIYVSVILWYLIKTEYKNRRWWNRVNGLLSLLSVGIILIFSVLGRKSTDAHVLVLMADSEPWDMISELYRNLFLYYPLGVFLPNVFAGMSDAKSCGYSIPAAFLLSLSIEAWQYWKGTGIAQVSDVAMNTLGAAIGTAVNLAVFSLGKGKNRTVSHGRSDSI